MMRAKLLMKIQRFTFNLISRDTLFFPQLILSYK